MLCVLVGLLLAQPASVPTETAIEFKSGKETVRAIRVQPAGKGPFPAIVLLHGDFGFTDWTRKQAVRLAGKGYLVLAVDLYNGELPKTVEDAHILERGLDERRVVVDIKAAVDYLQQIALVRKEAI